MRWTTAFSGAVAAVTLLGCTGMLGGPPDPNAPRALGELPATWGRAARPFSVALRGDTLVCKGPSDRWTWNPDHTFELATPQLKQGGSWQMRDTELVHLTPQALPYGEVCSQARVLTTGGGLFVVCAERVLPCQEAPVRGTVEVRDGGGGPDAASNVARALTALEQPDIVVFSGGQAASSGTGVEVRYRPERQGPRRALTLAEAVAATLGRDLDVGPLVPVEDPGLPSAVVVVVYGPASPRAPGGQ